MTATDTAMTLKRGKPPTPRARDIVARAQRRERAALLREAADLLDGAAGAIYARRGDLDAAERDEIVRLGQVGDRYSRLAQVVDATADDLEDGGEA